jgi:ATPase subunit of ABC transporter with duplicated ATPase domains
MSIIINDVAYSYAHQQNVFEHISFSVESREKVSIVGNNGAGKSTLLKLMVGTLQPSVGNIFRSSTPYYVEQHTGHLNKTIAEALNVDTKLQALEAILRGSVAQKDYDILSDDWTIEARCLEALDYLGLKSATLHSDMDGLSGGERTKVLLAGIQIHEPELILMDEPSNHLDAASRELLYRFIGDSTATLVVVSHDRTLLDMLPLTYELSEQGIRQYGGNYTFYTALRMLEDDALEDTIHSEEKALRLARRQAQEVRERQEKRQSKGQKNKMEVPRALRKLLTNSAENTAARLQDKHSERIADSKEKLVDLRNKQRALRELKIDFDHSALHVGKLLIEARQISFAYPSSEPLWSEPIDFQLYSNDRIRITGDNGSGKTTLINLLLGRLTPTYGEVHRADFSYVYLDQNYTCVDVDCTIEELAERYNTKHLPEHEIKLRLNRFLFSADTWGSICRTLSGGEKMRLYLCCLMISNNTPDLIVLDEPTNNLDIANMQILTQTIRQYKGSILVISHDNRFVEEIGAEKVYDMG